jgi:hypothetical protein
MRFVQKPLDSSVESLAVGRIHAAILNNAKEFQNSVRYTCRSYQI